MPRKQSKTTQRNKRLKWYVKSGFSANKIQKMLTKSGYGVRRKVLLAEIRLIKKQQIIQEKRTKHIPRKYRKQEGQKFLGPQRIFQLYRISLTITNIPVHSTYFNRNYLGFRLQAFHIDKNYLADRIIKLKLELLRLTNEFLHSNIEQWTGYDCYIGTEYPILINVTNPQALNGRYIFVAERDGKELYSKGGFV